MSITRTAPAPQKATSSVVLSAGLMTIPLSLYTSIESTSVTRHEFLDGNPDIPVGRVAIRKDTGAVVQSTNITRMAKASDGSWVELSDDEIATCVGLSGCEVVTFVPIKDAGCYLTDGLYQVRPNRKASIAEWQAFMLLLAGMQARKVHALVRFAMRGAPRHALLTTTGDLLLIATADSIREAMPLTWMKPSKVELDMLTALIDAIGIDTPTVLDDSAPKVQAYVDGKAKGNVATSPSILAPNTPVDFVAVLQASIDAAKAAKAKPARKTKAA